MDKYDKLIMIEKYIDNLEYYYDQIKKLSKFLNIQDENKRKALKLTLKITSDKIKKLKKCETLEEYEKLLDTKRIYNMMRREVE